MQPTYNGISHRFFLGVTDPNGAPGPDGPSGVTGMPGETGFTGETGPTGPDGEDGQLGPVGEDGEDGQCVKHDFGLDSHMNNIQGKPRRLK